MTSFLQNGNSEINVEFKWVRSGTHCISQVELVVKNVPAYERDKRGGLIPGPEYFWKRNGNLLQ